jgi:hypothetical protein
MNERDLNPEERDEAEQPSELDRFISAELDGSAAGFDDVALDATNASNDPRYSERRDAMAEAARHIGTVVPLDEVTRTRLVRAALGAAAPSELVPRRRSTRRVPNWVVPAGSVAAAVALVAGIAVSINNGGLGGDDAKDAAVTTEEQSLAPTAAAGPGELVDYGDVSDPARLRAFVGRADDAAVGSMESAASDTSSEQSDAQYNDPDTVDAAASTTGAPNRSSADGFARATECLATLNPGGVEPTLTGTGRFDDRAVFIATAIEPDATLIFVFIADPCRIVDSQWLAHG